MRRRWLAPLLALTAFWCGAAPAQAQSPVRTGWWNTATVNGTALPSTTGPTQLHLSAGPAGTLAFAAISYHVPTFASAQLTLRVVPGTQVGTPSAIVCPTRDDGWSSGGDQPIDTAPAYDCAGRSVAAVVRTDSAGTTLSFPIDPSLQLAPGVTSLAVLPAAGAVFSLDLEAPNSRSLSVAPPRPAASPPQPAAAGGPAPQAGPVSAPPVAVAPIPQIQPPVSSPAAAPLPSVAPSDVPLAPAPLALPAVAIRGPRTPDRTRRDGAVLLALLLGAFGYAVVEHRAVPLQLLGGRARGALPVAAEPGPVRGIGRYAKPRSTPSRRLT